MMGNHAGKDTIGHTGSPLDFFHTPLSSPSDEAPLAAMASFSSSCSSSASADKMQTAHGTGPPATLPPDDDGGGGPQKPSLPSEWADISVESPRPSETSPSHGGEGRAEAKGGGATTSPDGPRPASRGSPAGRSWQERDSGLESQLGAEQVDQENGLVMLSLMEYYRASRGLGPGPDDATGAVDLLRNLVLERAELAEEVQSLKETLRTERAEWLQFQCDLQVAVSVADRMRTEAEQALDALRERHGAAEAELARALSRQRETDAALESLRAQRLDARRQQPAKDRAGKTSEEEGDGGGDAKEKRGSEEKAKGVNADGEARGVDGRSEAREKSAVNGEPPRKAGSPEAEDERVEDDQEKSPLKGKGVAEAYLRSLASMKRKEEGCGGPQEPRRIVMLSERSWSLSRLPLPHDNSTPNRTSPNTSTTLPLCKKEEPDKGRRVDRILQRQDSWSSFSTRKRDEDPSSDSVRLQDGFSSLLRRHGGSRRNALLRWCQTRTHGYKNIEITNFSSSWEDGLALCAVYHTYLPAHIPYSTLTPQDKKGNLDLAFLTGESVGITAELTVTEMLKTGGPNWQRVLSYVESIFRHFEM